MALKKKEKTVIESKGKMVNGVVDSTPREKLTPRSGERKIGLSKSITIPTQPYTNIKVGVWIERIVEDKERETTIALQEMSSYIDSWLEAEIDELKSGE